MTQFIKSKSLILSSFIFLSQKSSDIIRKLLNNENYVNKAPKNIVDMDREKLKEEQEKLVSLQAQLQ